MKRTKTALLLALVCMLFCACGRKEPAQEGEIYRIYEVNKEETTIFSRDFVTQETDQLVLVRELLNQLQTVPESTERRAAISDPIGLNGYSVTDENVQLDFKVGYDNLSLTGEVLTRAAIVRTLTQIKGINYVSISVEGMPLANRSGVPIGMMTADQFIDNSGNEINTEEKVTLTLYFADGDGDKLVKVVREVIYNSNIAIEKLVMEQLILGTMADETEQYGAGSTINPDTKIVSLMVGDGVCYVNLDSTFLSQTGNVTPEVTIYSIVNSLVELPNVNKVQFSVNGETNITFNEMMPLSEPYERRLEKVENE